VLDRFRPVPYQRLACMRVKVRFLAEPKQPSIVIELPFPPRVGDVVELGYRRRGEVLEVARTETDKRYEAVIRVKEVRKPRALG
jgi:hypothetical protein